MPKGNWLYVIAVALVISLVLGVIGCAAPEAQPSSSTATTTSGETKTIKVGALIPLTGAGANWGLEMKRAHEVLVDKIKADGGLKVGNDTIFIEPIFVDNKFVATETVSGANKLIYQDGVKFITCIGSAPGLALLPVTEPNKVISLHAAYAAVIGKDYLYSFRPQYTALETAEAIYGYIATNVKEIKTVCMVGPDDDSGKATMDQAESILLAKGFTVASKNRVPRGTTDFYPILSKILPQNPNMIDCDNMPPADLALLVKQAREKGYKGKMVTTASLDVASLIEVAGVEAAEGVMSGDQDMTGDLGTAEQHAFIDAYVKKYGAPWGPLSGSYYTYLDTIVQGIEAAQSIDTVKVAEVLPDTTLNVLGVKMTWGGLQRYGAKHQIVQPIFTSIVKDGKLTTVGSFTPPIP